MRQLLLTTALFTSIAVQAQTLDADNMPLPGDSWLYVSCPPILLDGTGTGQTWDASGVVSNGDPEGLQYVAPESTTAAAYFPTADVALNYAQTSTYFDLEDDGLYVIGSYIGQLSITSIYTDPLKQFALPAELGDTWTDDYAGSYTYNNQVVEQSGQSTTTISGAGDLILPWGTVENVLRLDITDSYTEEGLGNTYTMDRVLTEFYRPGFRSYVARRISVSSTMNGVPGASMQAFLYVQEDAFAGVAGLHPKALGLEIFPNPTKEQATVLLTGTDPVALRVFDARGNEVITQPLSGKGGLLSTSLDLSELAPGIYVVRVESRNGRTGSTRLVVAR